jgi:hypothetical protein
MSNRIKSKEDYTDQYIGSRTQSKIHNIDNLSVQNLFFPIHDATLFQVHEKSQPDNLQLGVLERNVYHHVLINTKSQIDVDCLLQPHMLDNTGKDKEMSWESYYIDEYCKEIRDNHSSNHKCLAECNDINKTKSWVNYFALSLSNPTPIISFSRNNNILDNMSFCQLKGE